MIKRIYHTVRTIANSNITVVGKDKITSSSAQIHDRLLSWLGTATSIKYGRIEKKTFTCDLENNKKINHTPITKS
jgi:hypothetical protein